jgi:cellulose synthase (UDP-forming)
MSLTSPDSPVDAPAQTTRPRPLPITVGSQPDALWPEAEAHRTGLIVRAIALSVVILVTGYLAWRTLATISPVSAALGVPLLALDAWSLVTIALQTVTMWRIDAVMPPSEVTETSDTVAVLIPTSDEPHQVLMPTLAAATRMRLASEIIVLDDGHRPWLAGMCDELGVEYRARLRPHSGIAAQVNAILPVLDADFIVVLAADQVARCDLIGRTLGHFDDPAVALVQTAQDYYNDDSFEHVTRGGSRVAQQRLFERVLGAGRNRIGAALWTGGVVVLRRSALVGIGGVPATTSTVGPETTIRLHRAGWRSIHHNEVLARGRGALDAADYADREEAACTDAMQVLRRDNVLFGNGLTPGQRISHLSALTDGLGAWRSLAYLLVPTVALLLALTPAAGPVLAFTVLFPLTVAARLLAKRALGRGQLPVSDLSAFGIIRMSATLGATTTLLTGRSLRPASPERDPRRVPAVLWALIGANVAALACGAAVLIGLLPIDYPYAVIAIGAAAWCAANLVCLARAVSRIRSRHYGGDRRQAHRIEVEGHVFLDGIRVHVLDLSLTGVRVLSYGEIPEPGTYCAMTFTDPNRRPATVTGTVAGVERRPHGHELRVELESDQTYVMGAILAEALIRPA